MSEIDRTESRRHAAPVPTGSIAPMDVDAVDGYTFTAPPPLALYVHLPWCLRKCPYCDFNSHEVKDGFPQYDYVDALIQDLEHELPRVWGRKINSMFIGGGTPSLFAPEAIDGLLSSIRARVPLLPDAEITLEANPGTVEQGRFAEYRAAGVNRLSIGVQSFQPDLLERIGRVHGPREAIRAAEQAHAAGFDSFNLDLMFGLPGQSPAAAQKDVATAIDLEPGHISYYQLTIEPNTYFHKHEPVLPDDDSIWRMQVDAQAVLARRGFAQYEVSAYARSGKRCKHNLNYWTFGDYVGIGAGAHGKVTDVNARRIRRTWKVKNPRDFVAGVPRVTHVGGDNAVLPRDVVAEFMMNALRLVDGFDLRLFPERAGLPLAVTEAALREAERRELAQRVDGRCLPTERGQRYLNDLLQLFLPV
jgi:oxygen-independent coproporphyrinogen-3 oxidase